MAEDLTGYELSRNWFEWCYENPEKISPTHTAMYFFIIEHWNRMGQKEKFGLPAEMTKDGLGIKNYKTFAKVFNDIVNWGFIKILQKSKNQYSCNIIALVKNTKATTKALTKASLKHSAKQVQSIVGVDKPINLLIIEPNNLSIEGVFENFRKSYPGTKKGFETEYANFTKKNDPEIARLFSDAINKEVLHHIKLTEAKQFIPTYKNLQTWINQKCWEQEFPEVKINGFKHASTNYQQSIKDDARF